MKIVLITGIFISICLCNCKTPKYSKEYNNHIVCKYEVELPEWKNKKTDVFFGIQNIKIIDNYFFVTFSGKQLSFYNINDSSKSFDIDCRLNFLGFSNFLIAEINDDILYILDGDNNSFVTYNIDYSSKKLNLKNYFTLPKGLELDFTKSRSIRYLAQNTFKVLGNSLLISYSLNNSLNTYFLDEKAYLAIDINDTSKVLPIPDLPIPKRYRQAKNFDAKTYLKPINDSILLFGYEAYDSLYLYNSVSKSIIKRIQFSKHSEYKDFEVDRNKDLSYVKKFVLADESNITMTVNNLADKILIIKRLRKETKQDSSIFEYYLLNTKLDILAFNKFDKEILPEFCMPYEAGFLIMSKSKRKGYYYE